MTSHLVTSYPLRFCSYAGISIHLNWSVHVKPPLKLDPAASSEYQNVCPSMGSITGNTTVVLSNWILSRSGSIHPTLHSQWESRNVRTSPEAALAPVTRALISPSLFVCRTSLILGLGAIQSSSFCCKSSAHRKKGWNDQCELNTFLLFPALTN